MFNYSFEEFKQLSIPDNWKNQKIGLIIIKNNVKYEFLLKLKNTEKILVLGSACRGKKNLEKRKKPFFNRWSWDFPYSSISYNDPTTYLDTDLTCGWGVGTPNDYYLVNIAEIILELCDKLNIKNENIIFYGSSAGGFMSIQLSILIENSLAIAEIPQLNLFTYIPEFLDKISEVCFDNISKKEIKEKFSYRLDVIEHMKEKEYIPNAYLILDCSCNDDMNLNYKPFFNRLNELPYLNQTNNVYMRIDGKNLGHAVQSKEKTMMTIINIINHHFNNYEKIKTKITTQTSKTITKGQTITITGTLTDTNNNPLPNSQLKIQINNNTKTIKTDKKGNYKTTTQINKTGTNNITIQYSGNNTYQPTTTTTTIEITKEKTKISMDHIGKVIKGDEVFLGGCLTTVNNNSISNVQIRIFVNDSPKTLKVDENGNFGFSYKMNRVGINDIEMVFKGNNTYENCTISKKIEVFKK